MFTMPRLAGGRQDPYPYASRSRRPTTVQARDCQFVGGRQGRQNPHSWPNCESAAGRARSPRRSAPRRGHPNGRSSSSSVLRWAGPRSLANPWSSRVVLSGAKGWIERSHPAGWQVTNSRSQRFVSNGEERLAIMKGASAWARPPKIPSRQSTSALPPPPTPRPESRSGAPRRW